MLIVQPTHEQKTYAWAAANSKTYGRRGHFDGPPLQQYAGILGETVLADMLELPRPGQHPDPGYDFLLAGRRLDMKTILLTSAPRPHWANNIYRWQFERHEIDGYIFASAVKSEQGRIYFHGLMPKSWITLDRYLHAKGEKRPRGNAEPLTLPVDTIEVPTTDLWAFQTLGELIDKAGMID